MSKKMKIENIKLENNQKEAIAIVNLFRTHLHKHFEIVQIKSKKLIDSRWHSEEV